jgi:hypothetical protein
MHGHQSGDPHSTRLCGSFLRWLLFWRPPCLLRRVVVSFTHSETDGFEAILWSYRGGWLTLRDVSAIKGSLPPKKLPGDVVIHRSNLAYLQVSP